MKAELSMRSSRPHQQMQRAGKVIAASLFALVLANCSSSPSRSVSVHDAQQSREFGAFADKKYGKASPKVVADGRAIPKGGGRYQVGKPYRINGKTYRPFEKKEGFTQVGSASWYGAAFHGRKTANGEIYDRRSFTAAHPTMPLPSYARVTNVRNGHSIVVRVNDRGPYHGGRIIDVSERTAEALDYKSSGTARVRVTFLGKAGLGGSDDAQLLASLRKDGAPAEFGGQTAVASAEPQAAPVSRIATAERKAPPRLASIDGEAGLPGVGPAPRVTVNTLSEPAAPLPVESAAAVEASGEPVLPPKKRKKLIVPATAFAEEAPQAAVPLEIAPETNDAQVSSTSLQATDDLSALYYVPSAEQPAKVWKMKPATLQPLGEAMLHDQGSFVVSAGIYKKLGNAERLARALDGVTPANVTSIVLNGETAYAVSVGPFDTKTEAQRMIQRAIEAGATGAKLRRG
jgi:rare lipoprotein A